MCIRDSPNTVHVETVVKLSLKKDTPKIEVTMEPDEESKMCIRDRAEPVREKKRYRRSQITGKELHAGNQKNDG